MNETKSGIRVKRHVKGQTMHGFVTLMYGIFAFTAAAALHAPPPNEDHQPPMAEQAQQEEAREGHHNKRHHDDDMNPEECLEQCDAAHHRHIAQMLANAHASIAILFHELEMPRAAARRMKQKIQEEILRKDIGRALYLQNKECKALCRAPKKHKRREHHRGRR